MEGGPGEGEGEGRSANKRRGGGAGEGASGDGRRREEEDRDSSSAFDRVLAAAVSTFFAFLLAVRFLLLSSAEERRQRTLSLPPPPLPAPTSATSSAPEEPCVPVPSALRPSPRPSPPLEATREDAPLYPHYYDEGDSSGHDESLSLTSSSQTHVLHSSSLQRPLGLGSLATDTLPAYPRAFMDPAAVDAMVDGIMAEAMPDELLHSSDDSSEEGQNQSALPAYLDTITEEDTDDLMSLASSGVSSPPHSTRLSNRPVSRIPLPLTMTAPILDPYKAASSSAAAVSPDSSEPETPMGHSASPRSPILKSPRMEMTEADATLEADAEGSDPEASAPPLPAAIHFSRTGRVKTRKAPPPEDFVEEPRRPSLSELGDIFSGPVRSTISVETTEEELVPPPPSQTLDHPQSPPIYQHSGLPEPMQQSSGSLPEAFDFGDGAYEEADFSGQTSAESGGFVATSTFEFVSGGKERPTIAPLTIKTSSSFADDLLPVSPESESVGGSSSSPQTAVEVEGNSPRPSSEALSSPAVRVLSHQAPFEEELELLEDLAEWEQSAGNRPFQAVTSPHPPQPKLHNPTKAAPAKVSGSRSSSSPSPISSPSSSLSPRPASGTNTSGLPLPKPSPLLPPPPPPPSQAQAAFHSGSSRLHVFEEPPVAAQKRPSERPREDSEPAQKQRHSSEDPHGTRALPSQRGLLTLDQHHSHLHRGPCSPGRDPSAQIEEAAEMGESNLDMERVMERFHHYGELYGDAPPSGTAGSELRSFPPPPSVVGASRPLGLEKVPLPSLGTTLESVREVTRTPHTTVISHHTKIRRENLALSPRAQDTVLEHRIETVGSGGRRERPAVSPPQPPLAILPVQGPRSPSKGPQASPRPSSRSGIRSSTEVSVVPTSTSLSLSVSTDTSFSSTSHRVPPETPAKPKTATALVAPTQRSHWSQGVPQLTASGRTEAKSTLIVASTDTQTFHSPGLRSPVSDVSHSRTAQHRLNASFGEQRSPQPPQPAQRAPAQPVPSHSATMPSKGHSSYMNWAPSAKTHSTPEPQPRYSLGRSLETLSASKKDLDSITGKEVSGWFTKDLAPAALPTRIQGGGPSSYQPPPSHQSQSKSQGTQKTVTVRETTTSALSGGAKSPRSARGGVKEGSPTEWHLQTRAAYQPGPTRIQPPKASLPPKAQLVGFADKPSYAEKLHHKSGDDLPRLLFAHHLSSEHLQHLLEDPYYMAKNGEAAGSKGTLTTEVVRSWEKRPEGSPMSSQQNLLRWHHSVNPAGKQPSPRASSVPPSAKQPSPRPQERAETPGESLFSYATSGGGSVSELRREVMTEAELEREATRASRRAKYRHRMAKAKADFLNNAGSVSDLYKTRDEFQHKFNVSMEQIARPLEPARGPIASTHGPLTTRSQINLNLPPLRFPRMPPASCDAEYERLVREAEARWGAAYKHRLEPKSALYGRSRAISTGYLETNVDTGHHSPVYSGHRRVEETDLDAVHRSGTHLRPQEHQSRSRTTTKETDINDAPASRTDPHFRAKSVDYLMDRQAREAIEPPENQLQKVMGASREPSAAEVRCQASTDRLLSHVPDWYTESQNGPHHACHAVRGSNPSIYGQDRPLPSPRAQEPPPSTFYRPVTAQSNYQSMRPVTPTTLHPTPAYQPSPARTTGTASEAAFRSGQSTVRTERTESSYVSPWTGGRLSGGKGGVGVAGQFSRRESPSTSRRTREEEAAKRKREAMLLPDGMFDRYADEIEELRRSRGSLNKLNQLGQPALRPAAQAPQPAPRPVVPPVATVLPRQADGLMRDLSFASTTTTSYAPQEQHLFRTPDANLQRWDRGPPPRPDLTSTPKTSPPQPAPRQTPINTPLVTPTSNLERYETKRPAYQDELQQRLGEERTQRTVQMAETVTIEGRQTPQMHGGWSVSRVPSDWNAPRARNSRVIEVTDTFADKKRQEGGRLAGHLTLEEILDGMLNLDPYHQPLHNLDESSGSLGDSASLVPNVLPQTPVSAVGPYIFCRDFGLMDRAIKSPHAAEQLLRGAQLFVQCGCCGKTLELEAARSRFLSCKHCYTYYCCRRCRLADWPSHRDQCNFARINTTCKEVILKVKEDPMAQWEMSQVAREGNASRGRGAVNFRFKSPFLANDYVSQGWDDLVSQSPDTYLYYYTVPNLVEGKKDPSLVALCRRYDPRAKFILSVSIIADIEDCPETPPLTQRSARSAPSPFQPLSHFPPSASATPTPMADVGLPPMRLEEDSVSLPSFSTGPDFGRTASLPYRLRPSSRPQPHTPASPTSLGGGYGQQGPDAKAVLRSVLRSMENIAPGIPAELSGRITPDAQHDAFRREPARQTFGGTSGPPKHFHHPAYVPQRPAPPPSTATNV